MNLKTIKIITIVIYSMIFFLILVFCQYQKYMAIKKHFPDMTFLEYTFM